MQLFHPRSSPWEEVNMIDFLPRKEVLLTGTSFHRTCIPLLSPESSVHGSHREGLSRKLARQTSMAAIVHEDARFDGRHPERRRGRHTENTLVCPRFEKSRTAFCHMLIRLQIFACVQPELAVTWTLACFLMWKLPDISGKPLLPWKLILPWTLACFHGSCVSRSTTLRRRCFHGSCLASMQAVVLP